MAKQKKYRLHLGNDQRGFTYDCHMGIYKRPLNAAGTTIQEVKDVNQSWEPVYMDIVD